MFIARQPIFNRSMDVYGYELLYRNSAKAKQFDNSCPEKATASVLGGLYELGMEQISDNKISFVNFDYNFLFSDSIELIDPENLIIEILESTKSDDKLLKRINELRTKGYVIALDDFVGSYKSLPLIPVADIIKCDILATPLNSIRREVKHALFDGKILLAEKVETKEDYNNAKKMGFHLFQGYFFKKPIIIGHSNKIKSIKIIYLTLLQELNKEEPSYSELTNIIKSDVNLTYRLLRFLQDKESENSEISLAENIKKTLVRMGLRQIERWITILILRDLSTDKPLELTRLAFIRACFGNLLAKHSSLKRRSNEVYSMLLFSTLDALLDKTMESALEGIPLSQDVRNALIFSRGELYPLLKLVYSYEDGDWENVNTISEKLNISEKHLAKDYIDSLLYCQNIINQHF